MHLTALSIFGKEKLEKRKLITGMFFCHFLMTGKLSFMVTQEEMAGPDSEVNRTLQARSRL